MKEDKKDGVIDKKRNTYNSHKLYVLISIIYDFIFYIYAIVPVIFTDEISATQVLNSGDPAHAFGNQLANIICNPFLSAPLSKSIVGTNCLPVMV